MIKSSKVKVPSCLSAGDGKFFCHAVPTADMVFLVDGSWSIGRTNFKLVRAFLESVISAFHVRSDHVRVGEAVGRWGALER